MKKIRFINDKDYLITEGNWDRQMNRFSLKKLLSLLTALTVVSTSSINIVACGNKQKTEKKVQTKDKNKPAKNAKYTYYGINDKYYYSKQETLDDQNHRHLETKSENDFLKDITLGEKNYNSFDETYDVIEKEYDITTLTTKKDPKNFVVDATGQLSPNVVTDGLETSVVYRDINGKAIDTKESEAQTALKKTKQSYLSRIEKKYVVDNQYFDNKGDILSYYDNKYKTEKAEDLKATTCYVISNRFVDENEIEAVLERSLNYKFQYNGQWIEQNQMNDLSKIKLTYEDESKIKKFSKSPRTFLVEKTDEAKGMLTGSSVFEAPDEIADIIHDKSYWELK